jgi:hypothetical protein
MHSGQAVARRRSDHRTGRRHARPSAPPRRSCCGPAELRGTWLGLRAPTTRDQQTWRLDAGDELLLGTDGMFDQFGGHDGLEVVEMLSDVPHTRTLLDEVQLRLRDRLRHVPQKDDITMVLLRRRARAEQAALTSAGNGADNVPV